MAKLYSKGIAASKPVVKAPVDSGASSVLKEVVKKEVLAKKEDVKPVTKKVNADVEVSFYVPFAPSGKCNISIQYPVVDKKGILTNDTIDKQITIENKFFTVKKSEMKDKGYFARFKDLMIQSGFEMYSTVKNIEELEAYNKLKAEEPIKKSKEKKTQKIFGCYRPEHLESKMEFEMAFQCGNEVRKFKEVAGTLYTDEPELFKIFLKNGYSDMGQVSNSKKPSKEVIKKTEKE